MTAIPHLVGMVHLLPLPGSPGFAGSMEQVVKTAVEDARALAEAGFPAVMVENFGDAPFLASKVTPETIAAMTLAVAEVQAATGVPLGVNVLRNDGLAALGICAAVGSGFIRVNVLTGIMYTDQGVIEGIAADLLRHRALISPTTEIWADVMVKHATAPPGLTIEQAAADTVERGLADAVIVSGTGTGAKPAEEDLAKVEGIVPKGTRIVVGSGATPDNLESLMHHADTVIVGSALKAGGNARSRVDRARAERFVKAASEAGLT